MIIRIDDLLEQSDASDGLKAILKIMVSAINSLSDNYDRKRTDLLFKDVDKGVIFRTGGKYWRATLKLKDADYGDVEFQFEDLGPNEPVKRDVEGE